MRTAIKTLLTGLLAMAVFSALVLAQTNTPAPPSAGTAGAGGNAATSPGAAGTASQSGGKASGAASAKTVGQPATAAAGQSGLILPAGSSIHVRLGTTLTSKTNKSGDKFHGFVDQPLIANGKTIVPEGSMVDGHVVFVKQSGRVSGVGQMRIVLDDITTEDGDKFDMNASLDEAQGSPCAKTGSDEEGTIKGCGKSKKDALKGAGIGAAMGAGAGATVGMGHEIDCQYFGNCGGPSFGTDLMYGAAIGAGAALIYNILKHEKPLILIEGTELTFTVNRSVPARQMPPVNLNPGTATTID